MHTLLFLPLVCAGVASLAAGRAAACRCEPRPLAAYFNRAQVVAQVEVLSVEAVPATGRRGTHRRARIRVLHDHKNAAGAGDLLTELTPEQCGLALEIGRRYWIFATQHPGNTDLEVGACDGSREIDRGFEDVEAPHVAPRLSQLAAETACPSPTASEIAGKIRLDAVPRERNPHSATLSPNGAYQFWLDNPTAVQRPPRIAAITIDNEREQHLRLSLHGVAEPVHAAWVNEKLVYVRAAWSPTLRTDVIVDVEAETILVADTAAVDPVTGETTWLDADCSAP